MGFAPHQSVPWPACTSLPVEFSSCPKPYHRNNSGKLQKTAVPLRPHRWTQSADCPAHSQCMPCHPSPWKTPRKTPHFRFAHRSQSAQQAHHPGWVTASSGRKALLLLYQNRLLANPAFLLPGSEPPCSPWPSSSVLSFQIPPFFMLPGLLTKSETASCLLDIACPPEGWESPRCGSARKPYCVRSPAPPLCPSASAPAAIPLPSETQPCP